MSILWNRVIAGIWNCIRCYKYSRDEGTYKHDDDDDEAFWKYLKHDIIPIHLDICRCVDCPESCQQCIVSTNIYSKASYLFQQRQCQAWRQFQVSWGRIAYMQQGGKLSDRILTRKFISLPPPKKNIEKWLGAIQGIHGRYQGCLCGAIPRDRQSISRRDGHVLFVCGSCIRRCGKLQ